MKKRLEKSLSKLKRYYDYDDIEYKVIRDVGNLFNQSTNEEDYYKPIKTNIVFDNENNYMEYESKGDKNKNLSVKKYLRMIRPFLSDMMNDHKTQEIWKVLSNNNVIDQGEWKTQLSIIIKESSKDSDEIRTMHTEGDNIYYDGWWRDEIIEELFKSLLQRYREGLEESMKGSAFVFNSIDLLKCKLNKIGLNRWGSYVNSPKWLKDKKATISPKNNDDKHFQYALTVALNYQNIKKDPQRLSKN